MSLFKYSVLFLLLAIYIMDFGDVIIAIKFQLGTDKQSTNPIVFGFNVMHFRRDQ